MTERPRVLAVIGYETFLRNFVETGALRPLADAYDLRITASSRLRGSRVRIEDDPGFAGWFEPQAEVEARHFFLFNVLMWRHRRMTGAFTFRARRTLGFEYLNLLRSERRPRRRRWAIARFLREVVAKPGVWSMLVLGTPPLTRWYLRRAARALPVNETLRALIADQRPDVLVFPSSAYDPVGNDVSRIGKELGIPTLFLIDNWDNLSSKSIFWTRPDHVAVWGPQTREHAERIQGFAPARVHEIGTPRFDGYLAARDAETVAPVEEPYLLFVGCSLPFDEIEALQILDRELERRAGRDGPLKVVYRPHPGPQRRFTDAEFDEAAFRHVVLDPQLRTLSAADRANPPLDHYAPLLKHSVALVAPLTTMLMEGLLFNRPALALAYDDGVHYTSPSRALRAYAHFQGIDRISLLSLCHDREDLGRQLDALLTSPPVVARETTDDELSWFLRFEEPGYGHRLVQTVATVLGVSPPNAAARSTAES